jgi:hypothetical protein
MAATGIPRSRSALTKRITALTARMEAARTSLDSDPEVIRLKAEIADRQSRLTEISRARLGPLQAQMQLLSNAWRRSYIVS